jgi:tetratricopeptide (TPR) repeat protein
VEGLVLEHPDDPAFIEKTGELYGKLNDYDHAAFYLKKAFELSPSPEQAKTIFVICLKMDKPVQAMPYIDYALRAQDNGTLQSIKQYSQQIIGLEKNYKKDTTNIPILYEIKQKYLQMGNKDAALIYNQKILRMDPGNKEALQFRH